MAKRKSSSNRGVQDSILDGRALLAAVVISAALIAVAVVWRMASSTETLRKAEEFQFSIAEHAVEKFELKDPIRDFVKEKPADVDTAAGLPPRGVTGEERPDIHITDTPREAGAESTVEVIKSRNVELNTEKIDVGGTSVDVVDAPMEISGVSETVTWALNPIAADAMGEGDIFKYDNPSPRDRPLAYHINAAPRAGRVSAVLPKAFGDQNAPSMGKPGPTSINLFGTGDFFRTMDRTGTVRARTSVDSALHWLASHQEPGGMWDAEKLEGKREASLAVTGLSTLALMGGGNTSAKGEYRRNVLRALEAIIKCQDSQGHISDKGTNQYTHAICTIALCEAYGRARDPRILAAAQKAIDFCQASVNPDSGWRYVPNEGPSDTSVTAWFIQGMKTAKMANIPFKSAVMSQSLVFLDSVTHENGGPDSSGAVGYMVERGAASAPNGHRALTAAGMLIRQFTGMGVRSPLLVKGAELTKSEPPDWRRKDFYFWYYATYAMHNMGGEYRLWWNQRMRETLLQYQSKDGDNAGSWDPKGDHWASSGGRGYTTALGALCLEVSYRYSDALNTFGTAPDLDELLMDSAKP